MSSQEKLRLYRRPEYTLENMGRIFAVLNAFGVEFSPRKQYELDQLFCGIDFADQLTDNRTLFPNAPEQIIFFLAGKSEQLPADFPQSATENFTFLKSVVEKRGVGTKLEEAVRDVLSLHEKLLSTTSIPAYVSLTRREAVKSAEMTFLFLDERLSANIEEYMTQANVLGNLADNLLDLESDYEEGRISIKPSYALKFALKKEIVKQLTRLSWSYPQKSELLGLVGRYFVMLFRHRAI